MGESRGMFQWYIYKPQYFIFINNFIEVMLSNQLMQHITQIRRTDNDSVSHFNHLFQINGTQYYEQLQLLLQEAERLQLKNTTKFLAKKYLDIFLAKNPNLPEDKSILVIITCLRTAVKFNETVQVSEFYTMEFSIEQSSRKYTIQDFNTCQIQLLKALSFKLRMTSPYEFIVVKGLLPHLNKAVTILNSIIDFALSIPQFRAASAQGIFFGALLYACKQKNQSQYSINLINAITYKWQQANQIAIILDETLRRLTQQ